MDRSNKIVYSGFILFSLTVIVKGLAFVKDILVAHFFGMNELTDAYYIAFSIPHTLMYVLGITILRGMSSAVFSERIARNDYTNLSLIFSTIFNWAFVLTVIVSLIAVWFMPAIIGLLPFRFTDASFDMTVLLARLLFPLLITFGLSEYLGAILNAFRNFKLPAISLIIANICMIASLLLLSDHFSIISLAYGTAIGFLLAFILQFVVVISTKIRYNPGDFNIGLPPIKSYIRTSLPLLGATGMGQITVLISYILALNIEKGMVSALTYAGKINEITVGLFVIPFLTVLLPEFSRDQAVNDIQALKDRIKSGAEVIAAMIAFGIAFLGVFHREIIRLIFFRGAFTLENVELTSAIFSILLAGLCFMTATLYMNFVFLGMQKTKVLALVSIAAYTVKIVLMVILAHMYGIFGLAWAATGTALFHAVLLIAAFKKYCINISIVSQSRTILKIILVGVIQYVLFQGMSTLLGSTSVTDIRLLALYIAVAGFSGLVIYIGMLHSTKIFPLNVVFSGIKGYFRGAD